MLALRSPSDSSDPLGPAWLEEAARDITGLGSYAVLGFVFCAVATYLLMTKRRSAALWVSASILGGVLLSNALKFAFARPRPELAAPLARVFTSSFPSGHATLAAVTYLTLGALLASLHNSRRLKLYFIGLAIILTVAIGLSRVYLGVHYPTDVLAGWCIGAAWAALCWSLARWLQQLGKIEPANNDAVGEGDRTMVERVLATDAALDLIERLKRKHGPLMFHQSGGCCDGSAPMCYPDGEFRVGGNDVHLGAIGGCKDYMDADQFDYWKHTQLIIDVVPGRGSGFSLEAPEGVRFLARSRVFTDEEVDALAGV